VTFLEEQLGPWKPVSRAAAIGWLVFYIIFFLYAAFNNSGFLLLDYVNLIIHEGGHFFFSWFGYSITILGGTSANCWCRYCVAFIFSGSAS